MVSYKRVRISDLNRYSPEGPWDEAELRQQPTYDADSDTIEVTAHHASMIGLRRFGATFTPAMAKAAEATRRYGELADQLATTLRKHGHYVG